MHEELVTVATYSDAISAEIAKNYLEEQGVQVFVADESAATVFSGVPQVSGGVKLQVVEADVERAQQMLADHASQPFPSDEGDDAEYDELQGDDVEDDSPE